MSNSRGPETLGDLVAAIGPGVTAATFEEAVAADLILLAVPFGAVPAIGQRLADWTGAGGGGHDEPVRTVRSLSWFRRRVAADRQ
ncbi:NAD(P)-binding domain-containing protein [Fodinicola feengrottensis]|uniref:NAD(P)-binding domain-containing protein n=1 Tax=Fodinicola feengrottensis TaxID=435914 RepID=UPI0024420704|nr:NAD(P)-binding domain-containing protein [Fodinicola feengrottensis]